MNCLDTNALIDYLHGEEAIAQFLQENRQLPIFAPTVSLHEVFVGAARLRGRDGIKDAKEDLEWVEPLELTVDGAAEAAVIKTELREKGAKIGAMDTLIAGMVRDSSGSLVTRDDHFDRVDGLDTETY
ncbi:PIN domain-containing protein [Haloarcula brevis]|uniref:PIN domain-containing protein n=1 Tax=Haloarcula brevis TaxID=3111453 RepID=UPI00300EDBD3